MARGRRRFFRRTGRQPLNDGMVQLKKPTGISAPGWHDFNFRRWFRCPNGNQVVVNNDGGHGAPGSLMVRHSLPNLDCIQLKSIGSMGEDQRRRRP